MSGKGDIRSFFGNKQAGSSKATKQPTNQKRQRRSSKTEVVDLVGNSKGERETQAATKKRRVSSKISAGTVHKISQEGNDIPSSGLLGSAGTICTKIKSGMDLNQSQQMEIMELDQVEESSDGEPLMKKELPVQPMILKADPLFVEKYRPKTIEDIIGNEQMVSGFSRWLQNWVRVHVHGEPPKTATGRNSTKADSHKKAALLSGPPGIGKTTTAHAVSKTQDYQVMEVNASLQCSKSTKDTRKGVGFRILNMVRERSTNQMMDGKNIQHVIVMDEVDGISDRGAVTDVIDIIKQTKIPIICICNDKYNQKLKTLRNYCTEFDFQLPRREQVVHRLSVICEAEGIKITPGGLNQLYSKCGKDLRLIIGWIQTFKSMDLSKQISEGDLEKIMKSSGKDLSISPFEAARKLLDKSSGQQSLGDKLELVMSDLDFIPLLLQENYLSFNPELSQGNMGVRIKCCSKSADAMVVGDVLSGTMRRTGNWSLYPIVGMIAGVYASTYVRGDRQSLRNQYDTGRVAFSSWFGKNSSTKKNNRLVNELFAKLSAAGADVPDVSTLVEDYLPYFFIIVVKPIAAFVRKGGDGIQQAIDLMRKYCLSKEDLEFIVDVVSFKGGQIDPFEGIPSTTKAAFTRALNKVGLVPKTSIMAQEAVRIRKGSVAKKAKKIEADAGIEQVEEGFGDPDVIKEDKFVEDVEEDADNDDIIERLQQNSSIQFAAKGAGKSAAKGGSSTGGRGSSSSSRGRGRAKGKK